MQYGIPFHKQYRRWCLSGAVLMAAVSTISCGSDSDKPAKKTGFFVGTSVSGLAYKGSDSSSGITADVGEFNYVEGETVSYFIGELSLGSVDGAETVTVLSITDGAESAEDQRVTNKLILLQSIDDDGDLNNGIHVSEQVADVVSMNASAIDFTVPTEQFRETIAPLIATMSSDGYFLDSQFRDRGVRSAVAARSLFVKAIGTRHSVSTGSGDIVGYEATGGMWQYLGIPYAQPPVGDLRWRAPEPAMSWDYPRDAIEWGDQAAQNPALASFGYGGMSEDSLYLNVTAPKDADNLPVMVWFHGGGFTALTSNTDAFNNAAGLVTKGVIQVSVNHRLGPFGYIAHPQLSAESGYDGSGNYGQMDLVAALEWVQSNISAFGGDPDNVTIFGESGGGRKTLSLIASPQGAGLFHKAISQSGTLYPDTRTLADAEAVGLQLQAALNAESIDEMREASWLEVVSASASAGLSPYTNIDNRYQPVSEREAIESRQHNDVPFLFSINANDTIDPTNTAISVFPWLSDYSSAEHFAAYFSHMPSGWASLGVETYHAAELVYVFNATESAIAHYKLGLVVDPVTGQPIAIGDLNGNGLSGSDGDSEDILLSAGYDSTDDAVIDRTMTMWTNFAKSGNPSTTAIEDWPTYNSQTEPFVNLDTEVRIESSLSTVLQQ